MKQERKKVGAPKGSGLKRRPEIEEIIINGLSEGVTLRQICRLNDISKSAVYNWLADDEEFAGRFADARARGFDEIAAEALDIADDARNDWIIRESGDDQAEVQRLDHEHVARSKLRIETRLKLLAKWDPKRYGDLVKLSGPDGKSPVGVAQITVDMTPAQAAEAYAKMIAGE